MTETRPSDVIDIKKLIKKIWKNKRVFFITWPIVFVLSCIYIVSFPRYYTTSASLAPETETPTMGGGALSSIASNFGIDLSNVQSSDAISPLLYPDLMNDNGFVTSLFDIRVVSADKEIDTTYYEYLKSYQKSSWATRPFRWLKGLFALKAPESVLKSGEDKGFDPYWLSKKDNDIASAIKQNIVLNVDKRTGVINIVTTAQDPLICRTISDSIRTRLQTFITEYRTNKARRDLEYYEKLSSEAKRDYEKARQLYGSYSDANTDVVLQSYRAKQDDLENDMQLKYNTYTALNTQLQAAKAKVQERTPAFTLLQGASVPDRPAGPKRMIFVIGMLILASFGCVLYIVKDDIRDSLR